MTAKAAETAMAHTARKVLISGYIGFRNSGDEAVLMAIIQDLRSVWPDVDITVLSRRPEETSASYSVHSVDRFAPGAVLTALRACDMLISGGGSLVQDVTSNRSLFYYLAIIWMAKRLGRKVFVYANGVGPVRRPLNRLLTSRVLNRVDFITLRDQTSAAELKRLRIRRPRILVTADPVFGLRPAPVERIDGIFKSEGLAVADGSAAGPLVGISVRRWEGLERWGLVIAAAADHLVERYGARIVFLPMEFPGDVAVSDWVAGRMRHPARVLTGRYMATEYMGLVGRLDLLVGMRLHSLIFAARQGVPLAGLEYDPKVRGVLEAIGQHVAGHVDTIDAGALITAVDAALERGDEARRAISARLGDLEHLARQNAALAVELLRGS